MIPDGACPGFDVLEAQGFRVGTVEIRQLPIFDDDPELPALYRHADRLHVDTRDSAIEAHLLFTSGDVISRRSIEETERILRNLRYIREPEVRAIRCEDGIADLEVAVREVWTTNPGISFNRSGGENSVGFELEELNLLGLGKHLSFELASNPDRSSYTLHWRDPDVRGTHWVDDFTFRNSDDGHGWSAILERPFYSLDSRWSAGLALLRDASIEPVYRQGDRVAAYGRDAEFMEAGFGRSHGLQAGWTRRTVVGFRSEHTNFGIAPEEASPTVMPGDRRLDYPYLRIEGVQDDFETVRNRDQISRTEDQHFGLAYAFELGFSMPALGADRHATLLHAQASRGWRVASENSLFADGALTTRVEDGALADALLSAGLRYYRPTGPHGVFFAGFTAAAGHELDADHELTLGGDTGLRGYPLRYQAGSGSALVTLEQRWYSNYTLWKLADVGAALFFDMGQIFGKPLLGPADKFGLLKDVGFGLRLGSRRAALGNIIHLDLAFPLDGGSSIDSVQFLIQTKRSF